jgi:Ran GTPase-activating protein (RanGAP) involved in mRNA processing and transport
LELCGNKITDKGVEYLIEALKRDNCKLSELDLGDNKITIQGFKYFSEALKGKNCKVNFL